METQISFFKNYCFKMSTTVLSSPKFKLIEGYEVTTSPQKPELSPLLNRGIPLINWVENKALLIEWRSQIPVASNSLSRPSIYHNKQYLKVRYCYNLLHQLPGSMKAVVKATCMYIRFSIQLQIVSRNMTTELCLWGLWSLNLKFRLFQTNWAFTNGNSVITDDLV